MIEKYLVYTVMKSPGGTLMSLCDVSSADEAIHSIRYDMSQRDIDLITEHRVIRVVNMMKVEV